MAHSTGTAGLLSLTSALSAAADPGEILDVMTVACPEVLGAGLVNISLLDATGTVLQLVSSLNTPGPVAEVFATYPVDAPLPSRDALLTEQPVVLRSVQERDQLYPALADVHLPQGAFCVLPLISGRHPVGVLGLGWLDSEPLDDELLVMATAVASVCAGALHRALAARDEGIAHVRSQLALERLRALQGVAAELAHTVDLRQASAIVLESAVTLLGAQAAALNLLDERAEECTQIATLGLDPSPISTWTIWPVRDSTLAQELIRTGLPILLRDARARHERFPDLDRAGIEQEGWATFLLTSSGRALGMVAFGWREPRDFDVDDVALLQTLADHLGAALDRARLLEHNAALLDERTRIAETLQQSLLPPPLPSWPGIEIAAAFEPAELGTDVCGDFYDAFPAHDGSLIVVIGDVAGRGVAAAGLTGMARHTLRALARDMSPVDSLRRLNGALLDRGGLDGPRLMTAAIVRFTRSAAGVTAEVALSGHCLPVLVSGRQARHVGEPGTLLGAIPDATVGTVTLQLAPGQLLLLHTDGVIEARRNGRDFGDERLLKLLAALDDPRPSDAVEHVLSAVRWYRTTAPDDIAAVAVRVACDTSLRR
jgi:serine phosphatase RsbU (regulator of sigma subunit)